MDIYFLCCVSFALHNKLVNYMISSPGFAELTLIVHINSDSQTAEEKVQPSLSYHLLLPLWEIKYWPTDLNRPLVKPTEDFLMLFLLCGNFPHSRWSNYKFIMCYRSFKSPELPHESKIWRNRTHRMTLLLKQREGRRQQISHQGK